MKKFNLAFCLIVNFSIVFLGGVLERSENVKASLGPVIEKYFHKYCSRFSLGSELLAAYHLKDLGKEPFQSVDDFIELLMNYCGFVSSDAFLHVFYLAKDLTLEGRLLSQGWYLTSDDVLFCSDLYVGSFAEGLGQIIKGLLPLTPDSRERYDLASKKQGFIGVFYFCISKRGVIEAFNSPLETSFSKQAFETIKKCGQGVSQLLNTLFFRNRRYIPARDDFGSE